MTLNPNKQPYGVLFYGGEEVAVHKTEFIAYKTSNFPAEATMLEGIETVGDYILERTASTRTEDSLEEIRAMNIVGTHTFSLGEESLHRIPNGEIFVIFKDGDLQEQIDSVKASYHLEEAKRVLGGVVFKTTPASSNPIKTALALQELPIVEIAEPDFVEAVQPHSYNFNWGGKYVSRQWSKENLANGRQGKYPHIAYYKKGADSRAFAALRWIEQNKVPLSDDIPVAVIDDAVVTDFEGLNIISTFSSRLQSEDASPRPGRDKHGTAVSSAVGANNEIMGVSPNAPIHFIGFWVLSDNLIEQQFKMVENMNVPAVCCSWGARGRTYVLSTRKKEALKSCRLNGREGKGTLIVFASGNEGYDFLTGFAENEHTLAVGACGSRDELSRYSNTSNNSKGKTFCVSNSSIVPTYTCNIPGWTDGTAKTPNGYDGIMQSDGTIDTYYTDGFGGTSFAAPSVTGAIHLCSRVAPKLTATQLEEIIAKSCTLIDGVNGFTDEFGHGKLNVLEAVKLAYATTQSQEEGSQEIPPTKVQPLSVFSQGYGEIKDANQGILHYWNSMNQGDYIVVITDVNGNQFDNPDFDVYVRRVGVIGLSREDFKASDMLPTRTQYDYAGVSTRKSEILKIENALSGTYGFLVVSKSHGGAYKIIVRALS